jgi:hypothetical protein
VRRTLNIALALILAYAWAWTGWLKDNGLVNEKFRLWALIVITIVFVIQQVILNTPKPADRSAVEERREVIELYLSVLVKEYYGQLQRISSVTPPIRVNVALPTRIFPFVWRLMIYYFHSSDGSTYSNDELEMKFKKGEGAIGRAWAKKNIVLYDREDERFRSSIKSVRLKKTALVSKTSSVLAVPILVTGKTVATLSLDSEFAINSTKFDQREITSLAQSHANGLAGLCFFNGVR